MSDFLVGDHVDVTGLRAIVRYVGETHFMEGDWVGVELLDGPAGKNNGTVRDVQYFTCRDRYGMFVRPTVPRLIDRPAPKQAPAPTRQPAPRPPSVIARPPSSATKPRSLTLRSPSVAGSPMGTPTRGATPISSTPTTPRIGTPTSQSRPGLRPVPGGRPGSMGPPGTLSKPAAPKRPVSGTSTPGLTSGKSTPAPLNRAATATPGAGRATPNTANRLSMKPAPGLARKTSAPEPETTAPRPKPDPPAAATPRTRRESLAPAMRPGLGTSPSRRAAAGPNPAELAAAQRESEDLKSKIKILEKKRMEDREKLKTLERIQEEKDKYETIIQKLQQKYAPQQQEIVELRKHVKDMETEMVAMEEEKAEHDMILEMATLDREMAEEQSEAYKAELEAVRAKAEEYEMEVEILREENEELGQGMTPEEKTSSGWLQLEKQNERLRDALLRLREITSQAEDELKDTVQSLEEDNTELQKYKDEYETTRERLIASESAVDDLRQQLETALGAEEMLEELTERNMNMGEQVDELRATVEDLESLKEIADELEINHVESEKQMQEELDYRDFLISEQAKRVAQLDASNEEAEYTITRYRDVVLSLQSDLEDMRASQQITETESENLTARSRAMMDLNMKLQITAAKAQNKTIDLELRRLEAAEAMEHLAVVQMFLPESFHSDRDSVLALLRFRRVSFKANLLQKFVKERLTAQIATGSDDTIMAACDVCDKLTWVAAMCDRFINCIGSCSVEQFSHFQGALYELDPVERALNGWIEGLRRDELKESQCAAELQRTMALMSHLGEIHLTSDLEGFASDVHMRAQLMQSYMESTAAAVSHIRAMVAEKLPVDTPEAEEASAAFTKKAEAVISHSRSAKVIVGKVLRALDEFRQRSLSLTQDKLPAFEACEELTAKLAAYTRALGADLYTYLYSPDAVAPSWPDLQTRMFATTSSILTTADADIFGALTKELRTLTPALVDLAATSADIDMTAEFERAPPPWQARATELKTTKTSSIDTDAEIRRLRDDIIERATQLKLRDQALDEAGVKIELLESRMQNIAKQASQIQQLQTALSASETNCKALAETIESLTEDIQKLDDELEKAKKALELKSTHLPAATGAGASPADYERAAANAREVRTLKAEVTALQNALCFLQTENYNLRATDPTVNDWLHTPLTPAETPAAKARKMVRKEAGDVLEELRLLVTQEQVVGMDAETGRGGWRPRKETVRWKVERQKERYEGVKAWKGDVMARMRGTVPVGVKGREVWVGKELVREVRVRDPEVWIEDEEGDEE